MSHKQAKKQRKAAPTVKCNACGGPIEFPGICGKCVVRHAKTNQELTNLLTDAIKQSHDTRQHIEVPDGIDVGLKDLELVIRGLHNVSDENTTLEMSWVNPKTEKLSPGDIIITLPLTLDPETQDYEQPFSVEEMHNELEKRGWDLDVSQGEENPIYRRFQGSDNEQFIDKDDFKRMWVYADQLRAQGVQSIEDFAHQLEMHAVHRIASIRAANRILHYVQNNIERLNNLREATTKH